MKAFLLAAGEGRRLRPITDSIPKCLVPIRSVPLLAIWLELLERYGVGHVLMNVHHHPDRVIDFLTSYRSSVGVELVHEPRLLGSAGTVAANRDFVASETTFLIVYADVLTTVDLEKMITFHRARMEPLTMAVVPTDKPGEKGTVVIRNDRVTEFAEKAAHPRSTLANAGIYVANQNLFRFLPVAAAATDVLDFGYHVLPRMVPHVAAYRVDEFLADIGTPESYARAQQDWPGLQPMRQIAG